MSARARPWSSALLLLLAACGGPPAPGPIPTLRVVGNDFGYTVEGTPTAGPVAVRLVNAGQTLHQAQIFRLEQGKTIADLTPESMEHMAPEWAVALGGPNAMEPGDSTVAYVELAEGTYALLCFIPDTTGTTHLAHGMVTQFTVGPATGKPVAAPPVADVTIRLKDFAFEVPSPMAHGHHAIQVVNDGPQPHELVMFRFNEGGTPEQLMAWAGGGHARAAAGPLRGRDGGAQVRRVEHHRGGLRGGELRAALLPAQPRREGGAAPGDGDGGAAGRELRTPSSQGPAVARPPQAIPGQRGVAEAEGAASALDRSLKRALGN